MDVEEFLLTANRSKLDRFEKEIFQLVDRGVSIRKIQKFLTLNNVTTSLANIHGYIKRRQKNRSQKSTATLQPENARAALSSAAASDTETTRKIATPADIRRARKREIDLSDYSED